jgi:Multiubiquitin
MEPIVETAGHHPVIIHVNEQPVRVDHRVRGRELKQAAIDQGVPIQLDFVLSEELADRRTRIIGDDEVVEVNAHSRFIAVAPDDNS